MPAKEHPSLGTCVSLLPFPTNGSDGAEAARAPEHLAYVLNREVQPLWHGKRGICCCVVPISSSNGAF